MLHLPTEILKIIFTYLDGSYKNDPYSYRDLKRVSKAFSEYIVPDNFEYLSPTSDEFRLEYINLYNGITEPSDIERLTAKITINNKIIKEWYIILYQEYGDDEEEEFTDEKCERIYKNLEKLCDENISIYKQLIKMNHNYIFDLAEIYNDKSNIDHIDRDVFEYISIELTKTYLAFVLMDKNKNRTYFTKSINRLASYYNGNTRLIKKDAKLAQSLNYMKYYNSSGNNDAVKYNSAILYFLTHPTQLVNSYYERNCILRV